MTCFLAYQLLHQSAPIGIKDEHHGHGKLNAAVIREDEISHGNSLLTFAKQYPVTLHVLEFTLKPPSGLLVLHGIGHYFTLII